MKFTKILILALLFVTFQTAFSQEKAEIVIANAQKKAKAEHKNVMVFFHASWCGWCKLMDKKMNLPSTKNLFDENYVLASLDVLENGEKVKLENPNGREWMAKYGGKDAGLPYFVFINNKGEVLENSFNDNKENLGCPSTTEEVASFTAKLAKTSKLNKEQLETIKSVFLQK
ncbi:Thioredoxin-like [Halpernia humi]|uniref:Thioredoxin-like n=1 Tax=Halpernia humi TaxID=493375 RepID=A0A1H5SMN1_9FLAO|nr:thioredoxin family protein [Halpernia humi]SEF51872.1 Thioredoxin-like [Halpernia humi]